MGKVFHFIAKEFREILPAMIYFLIAFHLITLTHGLMLEEYGIPVVSADELSRMVVAPGSAGLAAVVAALPVVTHGVQADPRQRAAQAGQREAQQEDAA